MILYKYEFKSKRAFNTQLNKLKDKIEGGTDESTYYVYDNVKAIVDLGFIVIGTDQDNEPILSEKYCVDIVWSNDKQAENFVSYEVKPKNPLHKIYGHD